MTRIKRFHVQCRNQHELHYILALLGHSWANDTPNVYDEDVQRLSGERRNIGR